MQRREFLRRLGRGAVAGVLGAATLPRAWAGPISDQAAGRTLLLIELKGGNDGLNTLIPYTDAAYYKARPKLAIPRDRQLQLSDRLALHPALEPLLPGWQAGQMAVVQGLGYPQPNRSHFRSIDIWETGSGSAEVLSDGWLLPILSGYQTSAPADALVLGRGSGPVYGPGLRVINVGRPGLLKQLSKLPERTGSHYNSPALAHVLSVEEQSRQAALQLRRRLSGTPNIKQAFPQTRFGKSMQLAANVITAGLDIPLIKLELDGFDTHIQQAVSHHKLLQQLAESVAALRSALMEQGAWDRTLVMTYSEFGRRVAENGSGGTDHGTAAPHLLWGGQVKGGIYGQAPSLTNLDAGDLRFTTDYRSLYQTVARDWFGKVGYALPGGGFGHIGCLKMA
jgi:uncharacterized protein (DUF1501 family)